MNTRPTAVLLGAGPLARFCAEDWLEQGNGLLACASEDLGLAAWAEGRGLRFEGDAANWTRLVQDLRPDYVLNIAQLRLLEPELLAAARLACINFHDGALPRYAGLHAPHWTLLHGESESAVCWHEMRGAQSGPAFDAGGIYAEQRIKLAPDETAWSLHAKGFEAARQSFQRLLPSLGKDAPPPASPQDHRLRQVFLGAQRPAAGAFLQWSRSALELERLVRACDSGALRNDFALARCWLGTETVLVDQAQVVECASQVEPGTVVEQTTEAWTVACQEGALRLTSLRALDGSPLPASLLAQRAEVQDGHVLPEIDAQQAARLRQEAEAAARLENKRRRAPLRVSAPAAAPAWAQELARACLQRSAAQWLGVVAKDPQSLSAWLAVTPIALRGRQRLEVDELARQIALATEQPGYAIDHRARYPEGELAWPVDEFGQARCELLLEHQGGEWRLRDMVDETADPTAAELPSWAAQVNQTARPLPAHTVVDEFLSQARRSPEGCALRCQGRSLSYAELEAQSAAFALQLMELGVQAGDHVGLYLDRSPQLLVAMLGTMRAGAAYVPLDPDFPQERLSFIAADAALAVCVTRQDLLAATPSSGAPILRMEDVPKAASSEDPRLLERARLRRPSDVAYVLYTSGSTGQPKGVEVEHRNLVNFFLAMDEELGTPPGPFLAVSSVSFDISFLELWWTICRGTEVVLYLGEDDPGVAGHQSEARLGFGLFFWGAQGVGDALAEGASPYDFLLQAARIADEQGLEAVWTPERHFHAFGGLYPNPQVTSAALAVATKRVQIRSGSTVAPLHSPVRLAEDWAVIDQLSRGRAGVAVASGWAPNDFVILPDHYESRKERTFEQIEMLRRLWRGDSIRQRNGVGEEVEVRTQPRPVQQPIPIWVTAAASPETFERAGREGCHVLTHLLGQSLQEVSEKVAVYRRAWQEAGHEGKGTVSLMLHTFVGESDEHAREIAREPMKGYLRTAVGLVEQAAWAWPATKQQMAGTDQTFSMEGLGEQDLDALLDFAFERYFEGSGLFGSHERCVAFAEKVLAADVDEVACLIDYGVPQDVMLESLPRLARVRAALADEPRGVRSDGSILGHLTASGVRAMQCTPSMAQMMVLDPSTQAAMSQLELMLVGGEALPLPLAQQLEAAVGGRVVNMYGPTETTIWSTCHPVAGLQDRVPIGHPIANTQVYLLDEQQRPVADGEIGELWIGGAGVTRGYWNRPQLTAERFRADPWSGEPGARMYATGDRCSWHADGYLCFHGRADGQVKLRGYRIELGEIEHALVMVPGVAQAAALVREDVPGDQRLVAYYTTDAGRPPVTDDLRQALARRLPAYMIPQWFVALEQFPQTPNGKLDRLSLPVPGQQAVAPAPAAAAAEASTMAAADPEVVASIRELWCRLLGVNDVGLDQNFFEVGGHSLLAVRVQIELKQLFAREVSLVDVFRLPTIRGLAEWIGPKADRGEPTPPPVDARSSRAAARGAARRRALRARTGARQDPDRGQ